MSQLYIKLNARSVLDNSYIGLGSQKNKEAHLVDIPSHKHTFQTLCTI